MVSDSEIGQWINIPAGAKWKEIWVTVKESRFEEGTKVYVSKDVLNSLGLSPGEKIKIFGAWSKIAEIGDEFCKEPLSIEIPKSMMKRIPVEPGVKVAVSTEELVRDMSTTKERRDE